VLTFLESIGDARECLGDCWPWPAGASRRRSSSTARPTARRTPARPRRCATRAATAAGRGRPCRRWWSSAAPIRRRRTRTTGVDGTCAFSKANVKAVAKNHTCISGPNSATNVQMQTELMTQPLSICMDASEWQFYDSGVFTGDGCSETELDHAIQVVGWGEQKGVFWGKTLYLDGAQLVGRRRGARPATFASSAAPPPRTRTPAAS
jgi:hypothetical protein